MHHPSTLPTISRVMYECKSHTQMEVYPLFSSFDLLFFVLFKTSLELAQCPQSVKLVFADPALVDLTNGHWIEVVQFLASAPYGGHEVGCYEKHKMLSHRLPCHVQVLAKLIQSLAVFRAQLIE